MQSYDSFHPHIFKAGDPIAAPKTRWIWIVFWWLLGVTALEVGLALGHYYGHVPIARNTLSMLFVALTIVKAYYIIFSYMHLKDERKNFKLTLGILVIILLYFVALMVLEGLYQDTIRLIFPEFMKQAPAAPHH
jgi:cytochrome c oxidase subunit IV